MIRQGLDALYRAAAALAALSLLGIFLVMIGQVALRAVGLPFPGADDISAYLCVATAFFALALTFRRGEMIRVGLVLDRLPTRARRIAEIVALALAAVGTAYALWWTADDVIFSYEIDDLAQGTLPVPLWIPKLAMPLGAALLLIAILDELATVVRGRLPNYVLAAQERAARRDYSAEV